MSASVRPWCVALALALFGAVNTSHAFVASAPAALARTAGAVDLLAPVQKQKPPPADSCETRFRNCGSPREGTFSGRYVTPEDAARCHAERRACLEAQKRGGR